MGVVEHVPVLIPFSLLSEKLGHRVTEMEIWFLSATSASQLTFRCITELFTRLLFSGLKGFRLGQHVGF